MNPHRDLLDQIRIASPCPVKWEDLCGGDRVRHCDSCGLQVHNLAGMASEEVLDLLGKEGRLCGRLHRRADGTFLTQDCPVGLRRVYRRVSGWAALLAACVVAALQITAALGLKAGSVCGLSSSGGGVELRGIQPFKAAHARLRPAPHFVLGVIAPTIPVPRRVSLPVFTTTSRSGEQS